MDMESPLNVMQRVTMGFDGGLLTLNQCLDILNLPITTDKEGNERKDLTPPPSLGKLPRENEQDTSPTKRQDL